MCLCNYSENNKFSFTKISIIFIIYFTTSCLYENILVRMKYITVEKLIERVALVNKIQDMALKLTSLFVKLVTYQTKD